MCPSSFILSIYSIFNTNPGGPFKGSFWGGGDGGKITPCLKIVSNMIETSNLSRSFCKIKGYY